MVNRTSPPMMTVGGQMGQIMGSVTSHYFVPFREACSFQLAILCDNIHVRVPANTAFSILLYFL